MNKRETALAARDADLAASGLSDRRVIRKLGIGTPLLTEETAELTGIEDAICYEFPYFGVDGKRTRYSRWKMISLGPELPHKYHQEHKTLPHVYVPPLADWKKIAKDPSQRVVFTEGEKKAACACLHGLPTLGLGGVWNWRSKKWNMELLPEFEEFNWQDREIEICFDGDLSTNENVARALGALIAAMHSLGARVFVRRIPAEEGKTGMDDFLVSHGLEEYLDLPCEEDEGSQTLHALNEDLMFVTKMTCFYSSRDDVFYPNVQKLALKYGHLKMLGPEGKRVSAIHRWAEWPHRREVHAVTYVPEGERTTRDGKFNTWRPGPSPKRGKVTYLLETISVMGEQRFQDWLLQWLAYPVANPGAKLATGAVVWSTEHGTGKTMLGLVMCHVYGEGNYSVITDVDLHDERYSWLRNKQFILAEEVTQGGRRADNALIKHLITGKEIRVNEKFIPAYTLPNLANILFTSNEPGAMRLDVDDRRLGVGQVREKMPDEFWREMDEWLWSGEAAPAVHWYLRNKVSLSGFNPNGKAPSTDDKEAMIYSSMSALEQWCSDLLRDPDGVLPGDVVRAIPGRDVFAAGDLILCVPDEVVRSSGGIASLGKALVRAGAVRMKPVRTERGVKRLFAIRNVDYWRDQLHVPSAWAANYEGKMRVGRKKRKR